MTKIGRIRHILSALFTAALAVFLLLMPSVTYPIIIIIIGTWCAIRGVAALGYYFTMARHMVGGRSSLYMGVVLLDFGVLTFTLTDVPHFYVIVYLVAIYAFSGMVGVLRAIEAKRFGAEAWKLRFLQGIIAIAVAIACLITINDIRATVIIFAGGLLYSSFMRIVTACRRTKFIYIQ